LLLIQSRIVERSITADHAAVGLDGAQDVVPALERKGLNEGSFFGWALLAI
jgi:hypothetical protein